MIRHSVLILLQNVAVTLSSVEGLSAEAFLLCFDGAQHDTHQKSQGPCNSFPGEEEEGVYGMG